jgi:hypothetical protein
MKQLTFVCCTNKVIFNADEMGRMKVVVVVNL